MEHENLEYVVAGSLVFSTLAEGSTVYASFYNRDDITMIDCDRISVTIQKGFITITACFSDGESTKISVMHVGDYTLIKRAQLSE